MHLYLYAISLVASIIAAMVAVDALINRGGDASEYLLAICIAVIPYCLAQSIRGFVDAERHNEIVGRVQVDKADGTEKRG